MVSQFSPTVTQQRTQQTLQHTGEVFLMSTYPVMDLMDRKQLLNAEARHLHPLDGVCGRVGLVDEMRVLHVLRQPLQETQRFVKYHRHGDL